MKHESVISMWNAYLESIGESPESTKLDYESWHFCSNEKDANELVELVLEGPKRGTASLHKLYELENESVPTVGGHSVLTDWEGVAKCIIKDVNVTILPFKEIGRASCRERV